MIITLCVTIWLAAAVLAYGITLGYACAKYSGGSAEDAGFAALFSITFGVVGLIVAFCLSGFGKYGLKFRPRGESRV